MRKNGTTEAPVARKSHTARRVGVVLATVGMSFAAFAPMAHAFDGRGGDGGEGGEGHSHGPANESCGENGLDALHLHPLVSGVVHYGVEPALGGIDNAMHVPDNQGLEGAVHAIDCTVVVPVEGAVDFVEPVAVGFAEWQAFRLYGFVQDVCDSEFICDHAIFLP